VPAPHLKAFANGADIISVDTSKGNTMRIQRYVIALVALLGSVAFAQDAPKKITRAEALGAVVTKVQTDYPAVAKQLKIEGSVELEAVVGENGEVIKVNIVSGNPVLTAAAVQAVKRWKFKPFLEDGKPIQVLAPVKLDYKL
jgi:protein TonB